MKITMVGAGYVGLVSAACFSEFGFTVTCIDKDKSKIERLRQAQLPIYEPGLEALVAKNVAAGRLSFSSDLRGNLAQANAVFIAVGTPSRHGDGHADISYVEAAAREIASDLPKGIVVAIKSTVPVGTGRHIQKLIRQTNPAADFEMVSNPEFLREGSAIEDFLRPDRVVIGAETEPARATLRKLYQPLSLSDIPLLMTSLESAELIKYATNAFLAMKVTYINQMADLCERVGADISDISKGIGMDKRIGAKFLHPGPGFGGSCFPKDTRALVQIAAEVGIDLHLISATMAINERRKLLMVERIVSALGGSVANKSIAVLGLTFKPNTDDMREAPSLVILPALQKAGARIKAFDPAGMEEAKKMLSDVEFCSSAEEAMGGADALVLMTEWNDFRALDIDQIKRLLKMPIVVDLRNIYRTADMKDAGIRYISLGRSSL